jgi:hypothetical protein
LNPWGVQIPFDHFLDALVQHLEPFIITKNAITIDSLCREDSMADFWHINSQHAMP